MEIFLRKQRSIRILVTAYTHYKKICQQNINRRIAFFFHSATVPSGPGSPHYPGFTITLRHTKLGRTPPGRVIRPMQLPLPAQHTNSQDTDMPVPGGIRTRNPSKRTAADPLHSPRGH
jgi:hypothetical protein